MDTKKKLNALVIMQVLLVLIAAVISVVGIIRAMPDYYRVVVYACQAVVCVFIAVFGIRRIKDDDFSRFRIIINAYAFFEAIRAAILNTNGVPFWAAFTARFLLAILACNCVLFAERLSDSKESMRIGYGLIVLEILLYIVFAAGFAGLRYSRVAMIMPLVGVLIAGSMVLFRKVNESRQ